MYQRLFKPFFFILFVIWAQGHVAAQTPDTLSTVGESRAEEAKEEEIPMRRLTTPEEQAGANEFIPLDKEPRPLNLDEVKVLIGYPESAREAEIEGKVTVRIKIDHTGRYIGHLILKDPSEVLTKAVERQLPKIKFSPALRGDKPIACWVTIPFDFKLLPKNAGRPGTIEPGIYNDFKIALKEPRLVIGLVLEGQNKIPSEVFTKFPNLESLFITGGRIREIPKEIQNLKKLQALYLGFNSLKDLPDELWKLPNLKALFLGGNDFPLELEMKWEKKYGHLIFPKNDEGKIQW